MLQSSSRGDTLVRRLIVESDELAVQELLNELNKGYPPAKLAGLVYSGRDWAVNAAAWLISEVGADANCLIPEIDFLLQSGLRTARFWAVDALITAAGAQDGVTIARAVGLIDDPDAAVRWKVVQLLTSATKQQLIAGRSYLGQSELGTMIARILDASTSSAGRNQILNGLSSLNPKVRLAAVISGARLGKDAENFLRAAANSKDEEVRSFAKEQLQAL